MKKIQKGKLRRLKPKSLQPLNSKNATRRWSASYTDYLRSECQLAENTVMAYSRDMNRFTEWLGDRSIQKLTVSELSDFMAHLTAQKLAPSSIARHIVSVKMFFRYLQLEGVLVDNKVELLGSQKLWQRIPSVMSPSEVDRFLMAPKRYELYHFRDRALLEMLYATGCRASELSSLRVRDLHLDQRYCKCHGKGSKQRLTPLGDAAIDALTLYFERQRPKLESARPAETDWVFLSRFRSTFAPRSDLGIGEKICRDRGDLDFYQPPHATSQFRDPFACRRSRSASCSGKCLVTPALRPPRSILMWISRDSRKSTSNFIRGRKTAMPKILSRCLGFIIGHLPSLICH